MIFRRTARAFERMQASLDRLDATMERTRAGMERTSAGYDEQLQITREVIRRNEVAFQENSRILAALVETVHGMTEDVRAQTQAILRVLDRLDPGDGGTAAAG